MMTSEGAQTKDATGFLRGSFHLSVSGGLSVVSEYAYLTFFYLCRGFSS